MGLSDLTSHLSRMTFGVAETESGDSDSEFSYSDTNSRTDSDDENKDPRDKASAFTFLLRNDISLVVIATQEYM